MRVTVTRDMPAPVAICWTVRPRDDVAKARSTARPWAKSGASALSSKAAEPSDQARSSARYVTKRRSLSRLSRP